MVKDDFIRHDPGLVASSIIELICDDLRYQDKQNDPQYLMLNNKLREERRINKIKKKTQKKERKIAEGKLGKHDRGLKSVLNIVIELHLLEKQMQRLKERRNKEQQELEIKEQLMMLNLM